MRRRRRQKKPKMNKTLDLYTNGEVDELGVVPPKLRWKKRTGESGVTIYYTKWSKGWCMIWFGNIYFGNSKPGWCFFRSYPGARPWVLGVGISKETIKRTTEWEAATG